jgi:hypothetical protein
LHEIAVVVNESVSLVDYRDVVNKIKVIKKEKEEAVNYVIIAKQN